MVVKVVDDVNVAEVIIYNLYNYRTLSAKRYIINDFLTD
jgi:hypothetical protein